MIVATKAGTLTVLRGVRALQEPSTVRGHWGGNMRATCGWVTEKGNASRKTFQRPWSVRWVFSDMLKPSKQVDVNRGILLKWFPSAYATLTSGCTQHNEKVGFACSHSHDPTGYLWLTFVSPPEPYAEAQMWSWPGSVVMESVPVWRGTKTLSPLTGQRDHASSVRRELCGTHGENPHRESTTLVPWSRAFSLQNCGKVNFCCSRHPVCSISLWQPKKTKTLSKHICPLCLTFFQVSKDPWKYFLLSKYPWKFKKWHLKFSLNLQLFSVWYYIILTDTS